MKVTSFKSFLNESPIDVNLVQSLHNMGEVDISKLIRTIQAHAKKNPTKKATEFNKNFTNKQYGKQGKYRFPVVVATSKDEFTDTQSSKISPINRIEKRFETILKIARDEQRIEDNEKEITISKEVIGHPGEKYICPVIDDSTKILGHSRPIFIQMPLCETDYSTLDASAKKEFGDYDILYDSKLDKVNDTHLGIFLFEVSKIPKNQKITKAFNEYFKSITSTQRNNIKKFIKLLNDFKLNDIHMHNVGVLNKQLVIFDYAGV